MTKMVFLSFGGLVRLLHEGTVKKGDLAFAFYYLGCAKEYALSPDAEELKRYRIKTDERAKIHGMVTRALEDAEAEGRIIGWGKGSRNLRTYSALNAFLTSKGYGPLPLADGPEGFSGPLVELDGNRSQNQLVFVFDSLD